MFGTMNAQQQIRKEYQEITRNPMAAIGFSVGLPDENNIFEWRCTLMGPQDSPYKGGLFYLKVLFPVDYPQTKPEVRFITPIYHVNVNDKQNYGDEIDPLGHVCISTINNWKSTFSMKQVFADIFALFYLGNPKSPFSLDMKAEFENKKDLYDQKVKYFVKKYASSSNFSLDWGNMGWNFEIYNHNI